MPVSSSNDGLAVAKWLGAVHPRCDNAIGVLQTGGLPESPVPNFLKLEKMTDELRQHLLRGQTEHAEFLWTRQRKRWDRADIALVIYDPLDGIGVDFQKHVRSDEPSVETFDDGRFEVGLSAVPIHALDEWFLKHDATVSEYLRDFDQPGRFPVIVMARGGVLKTSLEMPAD